MFLALATTAAPSSSAASLPTLVGAYANPGEAARYVQWENDRADDSVYYVLHADKAGDVLLPMWPHDGELRISCTDGEWQWHVEAAYGGVPAHGTDFHATRGEAWADAFAVLLDLADAYAMDSAARQGVEHIPAAAWAYGRQYG